MIVIASDKFKGTLSSLRAGAAIREGLSGLSGHEIRVVAMADGGEGTACALGAETTEDGFYHYFGIDGAPTAYIPSCGEGLPWQPAVCTRGIPLRQRSSVEVGRAIRRAVGSGRYRHIDIGIGGTQTADGGLGMLEGMGYVIKRDNDGLPTAVKAPEGLAGLYRDKLRGLADVSAPLYSADSLSAMSFIAQKGADRKDTEWCTALFKRLKQLFPGPDLHGGAGGGIGFALESIAGCPVTFGASVILEKTLAGLCPELIITGEGRTDSQTMGGKAVAAVYDYADRHGIPAVTFCGSKTDAVELDNVFACVPDGAPLPRNPYRSLLETAEAALPLIKKLL